MSRSECYLKWHRYSVWTGIPSSTTLNNTVFLILLHFSPMTSPLGDFLTKKKAYINMSHSVRKPNLRFGSLSWVGCDQSVLLCISGAKSSPAREAQKKPCSQNQTIWLSAGCSWLSCPQTVLQRLAVLVSTWQDRHYLAFRNAHERKLHATINIICNSSLNQSHLTRSQFGLDMLFSVNFISAKLRNL